MQENGLFFANLEHGDEVIVRDRAGLFVFTVGSRQYPYVARFESDSAGEDPVGCLSNIIEAINGAHARSQCRLLLIRATATVKNQEREVCDREGISFNFLSDLIEEETGPLYGSYPDTYIFIFEKVS
jgi:hypothetical protein